MNEKWWDLTCAKCRFFLPKPTKEPWGKTGLCCYYNRTSYSSAYCIDCRGGNVSIGQEAFELARPT